jgi:SAM-dependent methyltransferase
MSTKTYWNKFYTKNNHESFEWLIDFKNIKHDSDDSSSILDCYLNSDEKLDLILDVGCGTSLFSLKLKETFKNSSASALICADFSFEAIEILRNKQQLLPNNDIVDFVQCDCKNPPFRDNQFNLVIDKGFLDSILKMNNSNNLNISMDTLKSLLTKLSSENSILMQITDEEPELRTNLFDCLQMSSNERIKYIFKEIKLDNDSTYFAYIIQKINV